MQKNSFFPIFNVLIYEMLKLQIVKIWLQIVKICLMIKIKFLARKLLYQKFILQELF
jgi:hypothetical protein